jgi:hypothetical protein
MKNRSFVELSSSNSYVNLCSIKREQSWHELRINREKPADRHALRHQLAVYAQNHQRPRPSPLDRTLWVVLSRFWPHWKNHLVVVRPETVACWHRGSFRRYWRSISTPGPGRPVDSRPSDSAKVIGFPRIGGLHHLYRWREAA